MPKATSFHVLQTAGLQPPPVSPDFQHKKEVLVLREQLDKLLSDLESKSHELRTTSTAHTEMKILLQQASESHCAAEGKLSAQIAMLRSELDFKTQQLHAEAHARADAELTSQSSVASQGQGISERQLATALRRDLDASSLQLQAVQAELGAAQQVLAGKQLEIKLLQQNLAEQEGKLEGREGELQAAAQSYAELEELVSQASEEQSTSEGRLIAQMTTLQDEAKVCLHPA